MRLQLPRSPAGAPGVAHRIDAAVAQPSTGSMTTRVPSSSSPTTPRGRGRTGTRRWAGSSRTRRRRWWRGRSRRCRPGGDAPRPKVGAGQLGGSTSSSWRGLTARPPGMRPSPATLAAAKRGRRARTRRPSSPAFPPPGPQEDGEGSLFMSDSSRPGPVAWRRAMGQRGGPAGPCRCSASQPRLRARAARRSRVDRHGKPTTSTHGRSEASRRRRPTPSARPSAAA